MKFRCIKLLGTLYGNKETFKIEDFYVIPSGKIDSPSTVDMLETILVFPEGSKTHDIIEQYRTFILCYTFLFQTSRYAYQFAVEQHYRPYEEEAENIEELIEKYENQKSSQVDFEKIESWYTGLSSNLNFTEFFQKFSTAYKANEEFRKIVELFSETVGFENELYNNLFQKFANLQTIFETLIGKPPQKGCPTCKISRNVDRKGYEKCELKKRGFGEDDIETITSLKELLNQPARAEYIHRAEKLDTNKKMLEEIISGDYHYKGAKEYHTDFKEMLKRTPEKWAAMDWNSFFSLYANIVKQLIYRDFLL